MTREDEIKAKAKEYLTVDILDDEYPYRAEFVWGFQEGAKWADETMIEKAEKWLENFLEKTIQKPSVNEGFTSETIICADYKRRRLIRGVLSDFKKAMEA